MITTLLALASVAHSAELHTCKATLASSTGQSTPVAGFGATEVEARRAARQSARMLADQRLLVTTALAWAAESPAHYDQLAAWVGAKSTSSFAAPGWTFEVGECTSATLEDAPAWSARWSSGSELVTRVHPADAVEASRRRACFTLYQVSYMQTVKKLEDGNDPTSTLTPLEGAWNQLAQCVAQEAPTVTAAEPLGPDSEGPARCSAIGPDGTSVAVGFGATAERAAEDALRQSIVARGRNLIGEMGRTRVVDLPAERGPTLQAHLSQLATFTGASDMVDRARLACSTVTAGPVKWRPSGRREQDCNLASWTERPTDTVAATEAGAFLDETCHLQVDPTMAIVRFSLRGAEGDKRDKLVGSAYRVAGDCEAACYADATWGTKPTPFTLAGVPERTDKKKVLASIKDAAGGGAPLAGLELLPTQQSPAALGALFSGETWTKLQGELGSLANKPDRWKQLEGHWILLP